LDVDQYRRSGRVFSKELEENGWVLFHGTSSVNAAAIEEGGFNPSAVSISAEVVQKILSLFEHMGWEGSSQTGRDILKLFSEGDFRGTGTSPIYFAENAAGALLYATQACAGGEKMRGVRDAIADLECYLDVRDVRQQHWAQMEEDHSYIVRVGCNPHAAEAKRPRVVHLDWLRAELSGLSDLRAGVIDTFQRHTHGVVYALRVTTDDARSFQYDHGGFTSDQTLPASRIVDRESLSQWSSSAMAMKAFIILNAF
jgi:hypothetical protein